MIAMAFKEKDGKASFSRLLGAACIFAVIAVYLFAAVAMNWETVRSMTLEVAGLGAALYGINRFSGALEKKVNGSPPPTALGQPGAQS